MRNWLLRFFICDRAATAIEYALIAGFIAVVIVAAVDAIGVGVQKPFGDAAAGLQ